MEDFNNQPFDMGGKPISPPPKLTYAQALVRWPLLVRPRDDNGRFKCSPFGKRAHAVEHRSAYGQSEFGIAGLNTGDTV